MTHVDPAPARPEAGGRPRIGILVVAYNAATTLHTVLDRIPEDFRGRIDEILVSDDASHDATYLVGLGYQLGSELPLTVVRQPLNLGYGGNQKAGYRWAIERGLDIVVMLHGDGQYAPEILPEMVAPLERGECDAVFGSRMLTEGAARSGGMPMYKYYGNRVLTTFENAMVGTSLSEWHSGYRAYSVRALEEVPFETNSDDFDFDTEIIIQLHEAGKTIREIPIPTYYGDEICYVNGLGYAADVSRDVLRYRLHRMGFGTGEKAFATSEAYELKFDENTSHGQILRWLQRRSPSRILDLGCSDGRLAELLRLCGHTVVGVDYEKLDGVGDRVDEFHQADLNLGIPDEVGDGYDVVLAADVLEHLVDPAALLQGSRSRLAPGGTIVTSVPNFAHWYPRVRVALGAFDYDRRGILDRGHLRFFTRRSFEHLTTSNGLRVRRRSATGLPLEVAHRGEGPRDDAARPEPKGVVRRLDHLAVSVWPTMFGYQFVYELEPA
jgi:glycosyltransferase involved in cell wall biosynthesis